MFVSVDKCRSCGRTRGERHKATRKTPSLATMNRWVSEGYALATDGCKVDPDGSCEHGHLSYLRIFGWI